ncbi:MAG: CAP domain-containing protein [Nocardioides sp.]|uniref:CAP domain-containing protein n=1 Tax=Nocardioides sp. TaxID=35761 RepID=UPI0039E4EEE2
MRGARVLVLALVVAVTLVLCPSAEAASGRFRPKKEHDAKVMAGYRKEILRLINRERTGRGLSPLRATKCANRFARGLADQMDRENSFHHSDLGDLIRRCGYGSVGENIVYGVRSARQAVDAWMNSSGHRANILTAEFRLSGIGLVYDDSRHAWIVVQDFGRR